MPPKTKRRSLEKSTNLNQSSDEDIGIGSSASSIISNSPQKPATKIPKNPKVTRLENEVEAGKNYKYRYHVNYADIEIPVPTKKIIDGKIVGKNIYSCPECDYTSESSSSQVIRKHIVLMHRDGGKEMKCKVCDFVTNLKYDYEKHIEDYHIGKLLSPQKNIINGKVVGRSTYFCPYCDFQTVYGNGTIRRHIYRFHCVESRDKTYNCEECDFTSKIKRHLTNHKKIHKNKVTVVKKESILSSQKKRKRPKKNVNNNKK